MNWEIKFKMPKLNTWLLLSMVSVSLLFTAVQAEPVVPPTQQYISPRLQLGIHTQASIDSPIKQLISSGAAVAVLAEDKGFSQIKTADGIEGWVKSKFLTSDEPATIQLEKLQASLSQAQQPAEASTQEATTEDCAAAESQPLPSESAVNLLTEDEKTSYEEQIAALKEEIKAWEQLDRQDKLALQAQSEKLNRQLKEKLAMIASVAIGQNVDASQFDLTLKGELPEIRHKENQTLMKTVNKNILLLLMVAGLSFFLGVFVMDLINRRRHGGYRV